VAAAGDFAFVARGAFLGMGEPATDRVLPQPAAPDEQRLVELCARTGIELL
jgi:hypothetical protein